MPVLQQMPLTGDSPVSGIVSYVIQTSSSVVIAVTYLVWSCISLSVICCEVGGDYSKLREVFVMTSSDYA